MFGLLKDLISSHADGVEKVSHTKVWSNIGMFVMTLVFVYLGFWGVLPDWYLYTYASVVAAPHLISKIITLRWGIPQKTKERDNNE